MTRIIIINRCSICVDDFKLNDKIRQINCGHLFHAKCIKPWLLKSKLCPNCKCEIQV